MIVGVAWVKLEAEFFLSEMLAYECECRINRLYLCEYVDHTTATKIGLELKFILVVREGCKKNQTKV